MMPLAVQKTEGDAGDQKAVAQIGSQLRSCMRNVLRDLSDVSGASGTAPAALVIEPSIVDLKKVNTAERIFLGPAAGSSAVLLKVKFLDTVANEVVAEPVFYGRADAWAGAFTFAVHDNKMLTRIINDASGYAQSNY